MKNFLRILAGITLFLVGSSAAFFAIFGALQVWLHMETINAILWSIIPSLLFGIWAGKLTKD